MKLLYLWDNDKEEVLTTKHTQSSSEWAHYKYAVDDCSGFPHNRYGMYLRGDNGRDTWQWNHIPKDQLPKKFIATLFLMGIN